MSEETGVTLTITGNAGADEATVPSAASGELWKQDQECYDMIETIVMNNIVAVADHAFTGLKSLKKVDSASLQTVGAYAFAAWTHNAERAKPCHDFGSRIPELRVSGW